MKSSDVITGILYIDESLRLSKTSGRFNQMLLPVNCVNKVIARKIWSKTVKLPKIKAFNNIATYSVVQPWGREEIQPCPFVIWTVDLKFLLHNTLPLKWCNIKSSNRKLVDSERRFVLGFFHCCFKGAFPPFTDLCLCTWWLTFWLPQHFWRMSIEINSLCQMV